MEVARREDRSEGAVPPVTLASIVSIRVAMAPAGKARPRVSRGHAYMPAPYRKWISEFQSRARTAYHDALILVPIALTVCFETPTGNMRPDADNAAGSVMDGLQGILYPNDRLIKDLHAYVTQGDDYSITITARRLGGD